jgi:hypothetical protein
VASSTKNTQVIGFFGLRLAGTSAACALQVGCPRLRASGGPTFRWQDACSLTLGISKLTCPEAAIGGRLDLAGSCRPPRSPVRPLFNALRAFNTGWRRAPYELGMYGRQGRLLPVVATGVSKLPEIAVDDVVP